MSQSKTGIGYYLFLFFWQFDNIANRRAHFETTGPEIWRQTDGRVDAVTFSTGTGGTIAGRNELLDLLHYLRFFQLFIKKLLTLRMMYYSVNDTDILGKRKFKCSYQESNLRR